MKHKIISTSYLFTLLILSIALLGFVLPASANATQSSDLQRMPGQERSEELLPVELEQSFTLGIGEAAEVSVPTEQFTIELIGLVQDSRCPSDVNCAQAGEAIFNLEFWVDDVLVMDAQIGQYPVQERNKVHYNAYVIELTDVQPPAPKMGKELAPEEYQVTMIVHQEGATPPVATPSAATPTPIVQNDGGNGDELQLGQTFELKVGESAAIPSADFSLTLRSLSDDSGCFSKDDCSIMTADGSMAIKQGEDRELSSFMVSFDPETPFVYEFAGFDIAMTHVEKDDNDELVATFVITKHAVKPPFEIPAADPVDNCPYFSRYDAMAILQEDAVTIATSNFILGPLNEETPELKGLCGYGSIAYTEEREIDPTLPHLLTSFPADHLMMAGLLRGGDTLELLPLVEASRLANPQGDDMDVLRVQTQLTVGQYEEIIRTITNNAQASQSMQVTPVDGIGDEAIWLWQPGNGGYFATVLARSNDTFALVSALVSEQVNEADALDYMVIIARRMIMPRRNISANDPPNQQQPTPEAQNPPNAGCDLISADEAAAILNEEVHEQSVTQEEGCGYVPITELNPEDPDFSMDATDYGIIIGQLSRVDTVSHIQSLLDGLGNEQAGADAETAARMQTMIDVGNLQGALQLLPELTANLDDFTVEILSEVNDHTIAMSGQDGGHAVISVVTLNDDDEATVLFASLHGKRFSQKSRDALVELFQKIVAEN